MTVAFKVKGKWDEKKKGNNVNFSCTIFRITQKRIASRIARYYEYFYGISMIFLVEEAS